MSRLLRSLREREEGCQFARPVRQLERSPPSRLVYGVRSVVDEGREILAGCSLLGFVKGCAQRPVCVHSHLLAYKRVVEVEERDAFDTATWAHYWLQLWRFAGEAPLLKVCEVRLFVSGPDTEGRPDESEGASAGAGVVSVGEGDRVDEDHHRLLLSFTETHNGHFFIAHGFPLPLTAHGTTAARATEVASVQEGSLQCHLSIIRSPFCGCSAATAVKAIHFAYTLCAPFPLFEPLQSVLCGDIILFNTAESINVLHFGDLFEGEQARNHFATAQVRPFLPFDLTPTTVFFLLCSSLDITGARYSRLWS